LAIIGNWGTFVKFQTSSRNVLTFNNMKIKQTVRTVEHLLIFQYPKIEYMGPNLQEITFTMELNALLGVRPKMVEETLYSRLGWIAPLVIGGRNICSQAMLTGLSSAYDIVLKGGEVLSMKIDVTMKEYR